MSGWKGVHVDIEMTYEIGSDMAAIAQWVRDVLTEAIEADEDRFRAAGLREIDDVTLAAF